MKARSGGRAEGLAELTGITGLDLWEAEIDHTEYLDVLDSLLLASTKR
jgi:hypothetical protein